MPGDAGGVEASGAGLDAFAGEIGDRTAGGFRPAVTSAMDSYRLGTQFGTGLSYVNSTLESLRTRYHDCLSTGSLTLAEYVRASEILVAAIRQVQENYGSADAAAAEGNDAVLARAMNEASAAVKQQREDSARALASAEMVRNYGVNASTLPGDHNL